MQMLCFIIQGQGVQFSQIKVIQDKNFDFGNNL